jgi:beta-phosphoglucomutase-like phosphatase (HAD superfamily)
MLEKEQIYQGLCLELDHFSMAEGTAELFVKLRELGIPFVIATASDWVNVDFYIRTLNLYQWFKKEYIIYNDGSVRGKPFPDLFLNALKVLGIASKDAVIFEDSIAGVKAAEASGAGEIIIVNSNDSDYTEYRDKYPIIKSFKEIDLNWFK